MLGEFEMPQKVDPESVPFPLQIFTYVYTKELVAVRPLHHRVSEQWQVLLLSFRHVLHHLFGLADVDC